MQTKQKWALTLMMALGAVSCGGSAQPGDPYRGTIDATGLDAKFQPHATCGSNKRDKCPFEAQKAYSGGTQFSYFFLGTIAKDNANLAKDALQRPAVPAKFVKITAYDFPDGCKTGKEYDVRTDAYREDTQYSVFDGLPSSTTSTSTLVVPLVKVKPWTGTAQQPCNAIKDLTSLTEGDFGGSAAEGESFAFRAIVDTTYAPYPAPAELKYGWYRGLQLAYFDSGAVTVDEAGNFQAMDAVWLKAAAADRTPVYNSKFVFQAKPGEANWSPVVRVYELVPPAGSNYTSLCYDPPCAADALDMTTVKTLNGVMFLASSPQ
ncbi:hypothetical protein JRI60_48740 [Archangium violaceum]|uniref:hypothetical protein n=1 Tax=Archangium violaceum TaxID=83451 RepID=UPI00195298F2|nr:hypothetical protein [Archangium violaceum]QRN96788.1 hypothetical protein JRI60_48740 [Archangium violaceum]